MANGYRISFKKVANERFWVYRNVIIPWIFELSYFFLMFLVLGLFLNNFMDVGF